MLFDEGASSLCLVKFELFVRTYEVERFLPGLAALLMLKFAPSFFKG